MAPARAEMLVRRPVAEVFDAFVRPEMLTRFWLDHASGPLAAGARVTWTFMVPGAEDVVQVTAFEQPHRIAFEFSDGVAVSLDFLPHGGDATRVTVQAAGFKGEDPQREAIDATEGFTIVLCDLKTLLETGRSAGLVKDKAKLVSPPA